ncbi:MAG: FecR domain-containing protein, partial [Odoribacter sp.]
MDLQKQQYISRLVFLYVRGQLTDAQSEELQAWRKDAGKNEALFQRMVSQKHFEKNVQRFVKSRADIETEWQKIANRTISYHSHRIIYRKLFRYAAALILPLGFALAIYWAQSEKKAITQPPVVASVILPGRSTALLELPDGRTINLQDKASQGVIENLGEHIYALGDTLKYQNNQESGNLGYHTLRVPRGGEYTLILADGSTVYLNAESTLKYPIHFSGNTRTVYLEGEAFFDVKSDKTKPFIVALSRMEVEVLGTSFGIRAYSEESRILTTLVRGKVNVNAASGHISLFPNHQASFDKTSGNLNVAEVDVDLFVGWKDGRLVFDNTSLEMILKDLSRWYSFDVVYTNN